MSNQTHYPHGSSEESVPLIEGVGNEILLAVFAVILLTPVITYVVYRLFRSGINERGGNEGEENLEPDNAQVPRLTFNNGACPICLSETIRLPCQTNCGHSYCGMCLYNLLNHYERDFFDNDNAMYCPLCRQKVTLIYITFNRNQQLDEPQRSQMERVTQFVRYYNRTFSGHPRSLMDQLTDLPITLRRLWNDFFTLGGFMRIRLRVQVCMYFISAMLYFFVPHDVVPETVFGFFGLVDDVLVMFLVVVYLAVIYRNAVVNDDVNDIGLGDAN